MEWLQTDGGYALALHGAKLICRNSKGKILSSVTKPVRESELGVSPLAKFKGRQQRRRLRQSDESVEQRGSARGPRKSSWWNTPSVEEKAISAGKPYTEGDSVHLRDLRLLLDYFALASEERPKLSRPVARHSDSIVAGKYYLNLWDGDLATSSAVFALVATLGHLLNQVLVQGLEAQGQDQASLAAEDLLETCARVTEEECEPSPELPGLLSRQAVACQRALGFCSRPVTAPDLDRVVYRRWHP